MKILIVCSINSGKISPFITEQVNALLKYGIEMDYFTIYQKGVRGYWKSHKPLLNKIKEFQPNIIHAHFGLSGMLANLQRKIPVVTTYHGCDINKLSLRVFSFFPLLFSRHNIFVSRKQVQKVRLIARRHSIIPCGVDFDIFYPISKQEARSELGWNESEKIILFSSEFSRKEKNAVLAQDALHLLPEYKLVELKNFSRHEVFLALNACDAGLLTSIREGSPMFIKELIACERPVVSTDVGDVSELINNTKGCNIVPFNAEKIAEALKQSVSFKKIEYPKEILSKIDNNKIAKRVLAIYQSIIH